MTSVFENNLKVIETLDAGLASRMREMPAGDAVTVFAAKNGRPTCRVAGPAGEVTVHSAYDPEREAQKTVESALKPGAKTVFILGLGLGYALLELARRGEAARVVVVEKREDVFRAALESVDLSGAIQSLQPVFLVGEDAAKQWNPAGMPSGDMCFVETAPLARMDDDFYREFLSRLAPVSPPGTAERRAARVIVFSGGGTVVPQIAQDFMDALKECGAECLMVTLRGVPPQGGLSDELRDGLRDAAQRFAPDFFLSVDGGVYREEPEFFAELGIPVAAWFVDNPFYFIEARHVIPNLRVFSWDRYYLDRLGDIGIKHLAYLPLGTNPARFHPEGLNAEDAAQYACDVSFVGDSVTANSWRDQSVNIGDARVIALLEEAIRGHEADPSRGVGELIEERERELGIALTGVDRVKLFEMVEEEATGRRRRAAVSALAPFAPHIWGDDGWKTEMPPTAVFRGRIAYHGGVQNVYAASRISMNVTKTQVRTTVNQRVFDVVACGGFVLTDFRPDLEMLFDMETEIACWHGMEELTQRAEYFLRNDAERRKISEAARRRVLAHHTYLHRAETLLRQMEDWR